MAGTAGDILRLTLESRRSDYRWYNVFHYQILAVVSGGNSAEQLYRAFLEDVVPDIRGILSQYVDVYGMTIQNETVLSDYYEGIIPGADSGGLVAGEALPEQWTMTFKCIRPYPPLRHGYKRFGGIAEAVVSGDSYAMGYEVAVEALQNALGEDISYSLFTGYTYRPVIIPGVYESGFTHGPWRATPWYFTRMGTQRTRQS